MNQYKNTLSQFWKANFSGWRHDIQHHDIRNNDTQHNIIRHCNSVCGYAECRKLSHYAECHNAECHGAVFGGCASSGKAWQQLDDCQAADAITMPVVIQNLSLRLVIFIPIQDLIWVMLSWAGLPFSARKCVIGVLEPNGKLVNLYSRTRLSSVPV